MPKFKVILPAILVLGLMLTGGVLLSRQLDPRLEQVAFEATPTTEQKSIQPVDNAVESQEFPIDTDVTRESAVVTVPPADSLTETIATAAAEATVNSNQPTTEDGVDRTAMRSTTDTTTNVMVQILKPQTTITCPVPATGVMSAQTLMQQAASQCGFIYEGTDYPGLGFFVERIDQIEQDKAKGYYWVYGINGAKANLGISAQTVAPGDAITWTYETEY